MLSDLIQRLPSGDISYEKGIYKFSGDQVKTNEIFGASGKCGGEDMCIHGFGGEA
jgi:hypothetical protein